MSQNNTSKNSLMALFVGAICVVLIIAGISLISGNSANKCETEGKIYDKTTRQCRAKTNTELFSEKCTGNITIGSKTASCSDIKRQGLEKAFLNNTLIWHGDKLYELGTSSEITAGKNAGDYCLSTSDAWAHIGERHCVILNYTYLACSNGYCFLDEKQDYKNGFVAFFGVYNMYNWNSFTATYNGKGPILVCGQIYSYEGHPEIKITDVASQTRLSPQASISGNTIVYKYSCN